MKFLDVPQSGSWAGNTHSHNRAGQYRRNRRSPVQPIGTGRRAFIRSAISAASQAWSGLTSAQRSAWISYADEYPTTDRLGQSFKLTGHQMFVRIYVNMLNSQASTPTEPPVNQTTDDISGATFTAAIATGVLTITPSGLDGGDAANFNLLAFSAFVSAGVSFVSNFNQLSVSPADTAPTGLGAKYVTQFGLPTVGSRIFARFRNVNQYGWASGFVRVSAVVTGT